MNTRPTTAAQIDLTQAEKAAYFREPSFKAQFILALQVAADAGTLGFEICPDDFTGALYVIAEGSHPDMSVSTGVFWEDVNGVRVEVLNADMEITYMEEFPLPLLSPAETAEAYARLLRFVINELRLQELI